MDYNAKAYRFIERARKALENVIPPLGDILVVGYGIHDGTEPVKRFCDCVDDQNEDYQLSPGRSIPMEPGVRKISLDDAGKQLCGDTYFVSRGKDSCGLDGAVLLQMVSDVDENMYRAASTLVSLCTDYYVSGDGDAAGEKKSYKDRYKSLITMPPDVEALIMNNPDPDHMPEAVYQGLMDMTYRLSGITIWNTFITTLLGNLVSHRDRFSIEDIYGLLPRLMKLSSTIAASMDSISREAAEVGAIAGCIFCCKEMVTYVPHTRVEFHLDQFPEVFLRDTLQVLGEHLMDANYFHLTQDFLRKLGSAYAQDAVNHQK